MYFRYILLEFCIEKLQKLFFYTIVGLEKFSNNEHGVTQ